MTQSVESRQSFKLRRFYQYLRNGLGLSLGMYRQSWTICGGCANIVMALTVFLGLSHWGF